MQKSQNQTYSKDEVSFLDYLLILAKHNRIIVYTTAAVTVLTYLYLFLLPNMYMATAQMLPPNIDMTLSARLVESIGIGSAPGASNNAGLGGTTANLLGLKSQGDMFIGMLTSNTVLDKIIESYNLRDYFGRKLHIEDIRKKLKDRAKIGVGKNSLILIEVTDKDPHRAADIANSFMGELDRMLQDIARKDARSHLAFLEEERSKSSKNLARAEETLRSFSEKTSVLQIDVQTKVMLEYIASLRASIDAKEVQIKVLRQQATSSNYDLIRLETELKGLKENLREAETQANQTCVGEVCLPTGKVPTLGMDYFRLVRDAKYQEIIYQMYSKLVELARMETVRAVPMVQIVDQASPPEKRSNKRLLPAILVGFIVCFIMSCWAITLMWLQQIKYRDDEIQRIALLKEYLQPYTQVFTRLKNLARFRR